MDKKEDKKYYDIKVEVMLPATLSYRIYAENPEKAIELLKNSQPHVKYRLNQKRDLKIFVYEAGSSIIQFIKNFVR